MQDRDLEFRILGTLLHEPNAVALAIRRLRGLESPFYLDSSMIIFRAIQEMFESGIPIEEFLLIQKLRREGNIEKVGGVSHIVDALGEKMVWGAFTAQLETLRELAERREHILAAHRIEQAAVNLAEDYRRIGEKEALGMLSLSRDEENEPIVSDTLHTVLERFVRAADGEPSLGVQTGLRQLDEMTGGLFGLVIIAGRPSMGKTALSWQCAIKMAKMGSPVGYISLETSTEKLMERGLCMLAEVPLAQARLGKVFGDDDWINRVHKAAYEMEPYPIHVNDSGGLSVGEIYAIAKRWKEQFNIKVLFVDYLQIIAAERKENRTSEVSAITAALQTMAKQLHIPIVVMSQLSRGVESRGWHKPRLSDLRDSGSVEQDAQTVIFIWRPSKYDDIPDKEKRQIEDHYATPYAKLAVLMVEKNKDGPTGDVVCEFSDKFGYFKEIEQ